ncbi:MAG: hypothetical protein AB8G18_00335 [Gammaproteobacteria bacterium]
MARSTNNPKTNSAPGLNEGFDSSLILDTDSADNDVDLYEDLFQLFALKVEPFIHESLRTSWSETEAEGWVELADVMAQGLLESDNIAESSELTSSQIKQARQTMTDVISQQLATDINPDPTETRALSYNLSRLVVAEWLDFLERNLRSANAPDQNVLGLNRSLLPGDIKLKLFGQAISSYPIDEISLRLAMQHFGRALLEAEGHCELPMGLYVSTSNIDSSTMPYLAGLQSNRPELSVENAASIAIRHSVQENRFTELRRQIAELQVEPVADTLFSVWEHSIAMYCSQRSDREEDWALTSGVLPRMPELREFFYSDATAQLSDIPNLDLSEELIDEIMHNVHETLLSSEEPVALPDYIFTQASDGLAVQPSSDHDDLAPHDQARGEKFVVGAFISAVEAGLTS